MQGLPVWLSLWGGGRLLWLVLCFRGVLPAFCPLSCFVFWWFACKYALIWRFKAFLARFYRVRVGLCCLGGLRGLCGFCVRERLGGLKACGVFALVFFFFALIFHSFALLLSSCFVFCPCVLVFAFLPAPVVFCLSSCLVFVVSFSLTDVYG